MICKLCSWNVWHSLREHIGVRHMGRWNDRGKKKGGKREVLKMICVRNVSMSIERKIDLRDQIKSHHQTCIYVEIDGFIFKVFSTDKISRVFRKQIFVMLPFHFFFSIENPNYNFLRFQTLISITREMWKIYLQPWLTKACAFVCVCVCACVRLN